MSTADYTIVSCFRAYFFRHDDKPTLLIPAQNVRVVNTSPKIKVCFNLKPDVDGGSTNKSEPPHKVTTIDRSTTKETFIPVDLSYQIASLVLKNTLMAKIACSTTGSTTDGTPTDWDALETKVTAAVRKFFEQFGKEGAAVEEPKAT